MLPRRKKDIRKHKAIRCKAIVLLMAMFVFIFTNTPLSFAAFVSDGKTTFTASVTIASFVDSDYDGISNNWELQFGLKPDDPDDAKHDNDNDGLTNLEEYRDNSDPTESESGVEVVLIADPTSGDQALDVTLEVQVLNDGGYDIVRYEFDFDGNGTYDMWRYASEYDPVNDPITYEYTTSGTHNAKLRATNSAGGVGIDTETIDVIKTSSLPDVITDPTAIETPIPYSWLFSGTKSNGIVFYQWDLTGNGEYGFSSKKSGSITHTYRDVKRHSFNGHFKVTDAQGLSELAVTGVEINSLSWYNSEDRIYRPKVVFNSNYIIRGIEAGEEILLSGYGIPVGGNKYGYARKLEWDFESDGIYDWVSEISNFGWTGQADATHSYGAPGIYRATLKVTTEANLVATDHVLIIVEDNGASPPTAAATVSYRNINDVTEINGRLPVNAKFEHSSSSGSIVKYEWDFNGDKVIDYVTASSDPTGRKPKYHYRHPGYYLATLTVTDANGLIDTFYIPVFVYLPAGYDSIITTPQEGQTIAGNVVTLVSDVFPDIGVDTVMFQYRKQGDIDWIDIGLGEPISSYMVIWDATAPELEHGATYELRAKVNNEDPEEFISIVVDNRPTADPDIYENNDGVYSKNIKIDAGESNSIVLYNGTHIDIPKKAIPEGTELLEISIEENSSLSAGAGSAIDIKVGGQDSYTFLKDVTIVMPYLDEDNDGYEDSTGRNENEIVIMWRNDQGEWEPLYNTVVYPDENYVAAEINHFSFFGAGFLGSFGAIFGSGSASVGSGAANYCFIATAAYDSADAEDVIILKEFRDRFLLTNPLGQRFVNCYYKYSPPIAEYIKDKPVLKKMTRLMLKPIVKFARQRLNKDE